MNIAKLGHCCLLIEEQGLRILTDPGIFTVGQHELVENLDVLLFTHEHADHYHLDSLRLILQKNPSVKIITNAAMGRLLGEAGIAYEVLEHGQSKTISGVLFEAFGSEHAEIYDEIIPRVQNTGYMIASKFFYPGDDLYVPEKSVEVLALPVAGPWLKFKEAMEYAKAVHPHKCFPVHDAILKIPTFFHPQTQKALSHFGIEMVVPEDGKPMQF